MNKNKKYREAQKQKYHNKTEYRKSYKITDEQKQKYRKAKK